MRFKEVITGDGTITLHSTEYNEAMHTVSGAFEEALYRHVFPSKILERSDEHLRVLDIGFGLGYNTLALISEFLRKKSGQQLSVITLERDLSYLPRMESIAFSDERDHLYTEIKRVAEGGYLSIARVSLQLIVGDARETIQEMDAIGFQAVFHDPYSPSKNPELWTLDFFRELKRVLNSEAILTTYSSAAQIRMALLQAGYRVGNGPMVGGKGGTLATLSGDIQTLTEDAVDNLGKNTQSLPYRDVSLRDSREVIRRGRAVDMRENRRRE